MAWSERSKSDITSHHLTPGGRCASKLAVAHRGLLGHLDKGGENLQVHLQIHGQFLQNRSQTSEPIFGVFVVGLRSIARSCQILHNHNKKQDKSTSNPTSVLARSVVLQEGRNGRMAGEVGKGSRDVPLLYYNICMTIVIGEQCLASHNVLQVHLKKTLSVLLLFDALSDAIRRPKHPTSLFTQASSSSGIVVFP